MTADDIDADNMSNEFDEVKFYNEKDERIKRGEERMYTSEEADRYFEEKFRKAKLA